LPREVAIDRTKVTLSIHQRVAHREILRHTRHCVVYRHIAVRVIFTQHFTYDTRGFFERSIGANAHVGHGVENARAPVLDHPAHQAAHAKQSRSSHNQGMLPAFAHRYPPFELSRNP